jgi:hypothetical protein
MYILTIQVPGTVFGSFEVLKDTWNTRDYENLLRLVQEKETPY